MFDWAQFLDLADELVLRAATDPGAEASWRAAISRAYYAAFHVVELYVSEYEGISLPVERAHGTLLKYMEQVFRQGRRNEDGRIHVLLTRLREGRRAADYDASPACTQANAHQFVKDAGAIITCVGHMRRKRPPP